MVDPLPNFRLPKVQINMNAQYSCEDDSDRWKVLRDWEYTMVGILGTVFEKVEKKKVLHQRSQEV